MVFVVHRLDKFVSGLLVFARTESVKERLQSLFRKHDIRRNYWAIVEGKFDKRAVRSGAAWLRTAPAGCVRWREAARGARRQSPTIVFCGPFRTSRCSRLHRDGPQEPDPGPPCRERPPDRRRPGIREHDRPAGPDRTPRIPPRVRPPRNGRTDVVRDGTAIGVPAVSPGRPLSQTVNLPCWPVIDSSRVWKGATCWHSWMPEPMASPWPLSTNGQPRPAEVLILGDEAEVTRRAEDASALLAGQRILPRLMW